MKIDNIIQTIYDNPLQVWCQNTYSYYTMGSYKTNSPEVTVYHFSDTDTDKEMCLFERVQDGKVIGFSSIRLYYMGLELLFPDTNELEYFIVNEC